MSLADVVCDRALDVRMDRVTVEPEATHKRRVLCVELSTDADRRSVGDGGSALVLHQSRPAAISHVLLC